MKHFLVFFLLIAKTIEAQECDSLYQFSNLSDLGCSKTYADLLFINNEKDYLEYSRYNFLSYKEDYYFDLVFDRESIVRGNFYLVVYECKYDSAHEHSAQRKPDKYSLVSDMPTILEISFTKEEIRKLNSQIDVCGLNELLVQSTVSISNDFTVPYYYYIDSAKIESSYYKCNYLVEYTSKCAKVELGLQSIPTESNVFRALMNEVDHSISFKKKRRMCIKDLPFKYYSFDGGYYYIRKNWPFGRF
jgi:hypothetical protein